MKHAAYLLTGALWSGVMVTVAHGQNAAVPPANAPTFSKDVAPILYKNCTNCHRPVFTMLGDYPIPADGTIAYQYFEVPTNLTEDKWIRAIEVRPGNRELVHHVIIHAREPHPEKRPPVFNRAEGMDVPAGQTGGPKLPPDKRRPLGPNDRQSEDSRRRGESSRRCRDDHAA